MVLHQTAGRASGQGVPGTEAQAVRYDTPWERREKNKILVPPRDSAVCHSTVDRLELRLALFGFEGCCYTLTFDDDHLPLKFRDARAAARNFWVKLQRWNGGKAFDRVSLIEGKHGDQRYHLHAVLRYGQFPPALIQHLWTAGFVDDEPLLRGPADSYRRMARYYTKESTDGIIIPTGSRPWTSSRTLTRQLPPPKNGCPPAETSVFQRTHTPAGETKSRTNLESTTTPGTSTKRPEILLFKGT